MSDKPPRYASWTAGKMPLPELLELKRRGEKIVMVTAYDAPGARLAEQAGIDILLVGDTAGMVVLGHEGTVPVTMEEMLFLTRTVARAVERPVVVGDLPFGSYHVSDEDAVRNAVRFVKEAGADVVKLEGAAAPGRRARARGGGVLCRRARGGAGSGRGAHHRGADGADDRHRRRCRVRRAGARLPRPARSDRR